MLGLLGYKTKTMTVGKVYIDLTFTDESNQFYNNKFAEFS